jgi:hypothetical protein
MNTSVYMVCCALIMHFIGVKAFWNNTSMKLMNMSMTLIFHVQLVLCISIYLGFTYVVLCMCSLYCNVYTLCSLCNIMYFYSKHGINYMCIWICSNNTRQMFHIR